MCVHAYTLKCMLGDFICKRKEGEGGKEGKRIGGWGCGGAVKKEKVKVL